uniref:Transcriptional regulator n=1 Tax=Haemonchus placei TaxID=6290 RepID=A0A0N4XAM0_HAEPC
LNGFFESSADGRLALGAFVDEIRLPVESDDLVLKVLRSANGLRSSSSSKGLPSPLLESAGDTAVDPFF